jgi:hypothetical protein
MAETKVKPAKRVAGKSKFRLPDRTPRVAEINPLRELLQEAKAQEAASISSSPTEDTTPAKKIAGVSQFPTPSRALDIAPANMGTGAVRPHDPKSNTGNANSFGDFAKRWAPILRSGQMSVCRILFEMTYALGQTECFTSMPKLAAAAGLKERQCYNVVAQLELLGFVERPDIYNTPTKKGTVFRLFLSPQAPSGSNRRYHIGGENQDQ